MQAWSTCVAAIIASSVLGGPARSQDQAPATDITQQPTLYVVGYAHLDTQWRWTYAQTIREYLAHTLHDNFKLLEKHPQYVFNFTGARRYEMFKEYFPEEYEKLKEYIAAGRWFPCGSSMDENDSNSPSAESLIRNVMYGNRYFRHEFGVASSEYMLPDCFGFPAALPSILAHCGLKGFSTQKLTWGSVVGIPFNVGVWVGPDGSSVVAALNPGQYDGDVKENLATSATWKKRIDADGQKSGVFADFHYYGTGDVGGAPKEASVAMVEESLSTKGPTTVVAGRADALFEAITPEMQKTLPRYKGELELTEHSAGSLTSQAFMKHMNRKNEQLANAAESASVIAWWLGGRAYPAQRLENAWTLVLGSQMHDIISGTALARGYEYAWNDELLAANQFAAVLRDAVEVIAGQMDTRGHGVPIVVFNPLSIEREDVVEVELSRTEYSDGVRVTGADGTEVPAQLLVPRMPGGAPEPETGPNGIDESYSKSAEEGTSSRVRVAFLAKVPSVGSAVFHLDWLTDRPVAPADSPLHVERRRLENARYVIQIDESGDVASIHDKQANREMLSAPARLGLHYENPRNWPAWNQDWSDRQKPAREFVGGPARIRVIERGPARVAVEVTRESGGSTFVQRIRLSSGSASDRIEFDTDIDWATRERSLRAAFPLAVSNPKATYDIQTGVLERPNMFPKQYEYGFQQWFDLTDAKGDYGVSVMCDSKYGCDKPDDSTLRLTLLHTPGTRGGYQDQASQDLGRHHVLYALSGHAGDWRKGRSAQDAARLNQPLLPFLTSAHEGRLGKSFAFLTTGTDDVRIQAIKKIEDGDEIVVRLRELSGANSTAGSVHVRAPVAALGIQFAREIDGQELPVGPAQAENGELASEVHGYGLRAFALKLGRPAAPAVRAESDPLDLPFDADVVSTNAKRGDGAMDARGATYPAEQMPETISAGVAKFKLGSTADGAKNALTCRGQEISWMSDGDHDRLCLLAASSDGDVETSIEVDGKQIAITFHPWNGFVGQWDHRSWRNEELTGIEPGFVKSGDVAWFASHHHTPSGDAHYQYCYLWQHELELPKGAQKIRLPNDPRVKVMAASVVSSHRPRVVPAAALIDTLKDHAQDAPRIVPGSGHFDDGVEVRVEPRMYWGHGKLRYTLDGSNPTASSTVYAGPFFLNRKQTVRAAIVDGAGRVGSGASAEIDVDDVTPPTLVKVSPAYGSPVMRLRFSEPVDDSATHATNYVLDPAIAVSSARAGDDAREVVLQLAAPLAVEQTYRLSITGVKDASPAHNAMKPAAVEVKVPGPVYQLAEVKPEQMGTTIRDVPGLPIKAGDAWTLSMFVRTDKEPDDRTILAGFGRCEQATDGDARYMAKFPGGLQFWSHNRDVEGHVPLELGRWQMLTATYDGQVLRFYKDAKKIGERAVELADDENRVCFAPPDPWEQKRRFQGEIREFRIWGAALSDDAIRSLKDSAALR